MENNSKRYDLHPLCTFFPRLGDAEFRELVADICAAGLRQPIVLYDGMILDGGNRYAACIEAGVEPRFVEYNGDDIVSFVISANLARRHLTPGQRSAIVASTQNWAESAGHGGARGGGILANTNGANTEKLTESMGISSDQMITCSDDDGGYSEIDSLRDQVLDLQSMLAVHCTPEEEREIAESIVTRLRDEVRILSRQLSAVTAMRDRYMKENARLKKYAESMAKKLRALDKK